MPVTQRCRSDEGDAVHVHVALPAAALDMQGGGPFSSYVCLTVRSGTAVRWCAPHVTAGEGGGVGQQLLRPPIAECKVMPMDFRLTIRTSRYEFVLHKDRLYGAVDPRK